MAGRGRHERNMGQIHSGNCPPDAEGHLIIDKVNWRL
jgi:hypothetical protein